MTYPGGIGGSGQGMITTLTDKERRDEADRILKILDREKIVNFADGKVVRTDLSHNSMVFLTDMMCGGEVTPKQLFHLRDLKDKLLG